MNLFYTKTDPRDQIKYCKQKQFVLFLICMLILFAQKRDDIFVINSIHFCCSKYMQTFGLIDICF